MQLIEISPNEIWSYYPYAKPNRALIDKIRMNGWKGIPPIPVFRIPEFGVPKFEEPLEYKIEHTFIAMDGSHRRIAAAHLQVRIPAAVYEYGERVDAEKHGLAPFGHAADPKIYEKLTKAYILRDNPAFKQKVQRQKR